MHGMYVSSNRGQPVKHEIIHRKGKTMMNENSKTKHSPLWYEGNRVNETLFCTEFLRENRLLYSDGAFFTPDGIMGDETELRMRIYEVIRGIISRNVARTVTSLTEVMKLEAQAPDFVPDPGRIHTANGTLTVDGVFTPGKCEIVRSRFPVRYNPDAPEPAVWLRFLSDLLHEDDIPTLQEFMGYCLIPSTKAQRMMIIKGQGGEGKSQIGKVLKALFGVNMKDGSVTKISENQFARADLEHLHLMVDDDMEMEGLRQTNYVKSIVTAYGKMDLEQKGRQSYQGYLYARLLAFSNGDLQALCDKSDGFYRRQLILTTKPRPADRADDPDLGSKMADELEGIFLWAFRGLQRLIANHYRFTESGRTAANRETVKRDANNILEFMDSEGYIRRDPMLSVSSRELYLIYLTWCDENAMSPVKSRVFSKYLIGCHQKYALTYSNNIVNSAGRRVWGFQGIGRADPLDALN